MNYMKTSDEQTLDQNSFIRVKGKKFYEKIGDFFLT